MPPLAMPPDTGSARAREREELQYLLGNEPGWMSRYGIAAMAAVFLLLGAGSYAVRYPDVIEAPAVLTMDHPPIRVLAGSGGRIAELLAADGQQAAAGEVLAAMETPADWRDVLRLEAWLGEPGLQAPSAELPGPLRLGQLQGSYSAFAQRWKDYRYFLQQDGAEQQAAALRRQIAHLEAANENLHSQQRLMARELALAARELERQRQLHASGVISDKEWEGAEAAYIAQQRQMQAAAAAVLQNEMQIGQSEARIAELEQARSDLDNDKQLALEEDAQRLRSAIAEWKQSFLIVAPVSGQVSLYRVWSAHQSVAAGEEVLAVSPALGSGGGIVAKAELPAAQSGRAGIGSPASIRLDGYPAEQFGSIEAQVSSLALLPRSEAYLLDIRLPDTLRTSYGNVIPFRPEMSGTARIITEDRRVIERIFGRLRDLLQNR
jgi:multidrug resistance efflux pump